MHLSLCYEFFTAPRPISAGKHGSHLTSAEPDGLDRDPDRNEHATPKEPARSQPGPRRGNRAPVANFAAVSNNQDCAKETVETAEPGFFHHPASDPGGQAEQEHDGKKDDEEAKNLS